MMINTSDIILRLGIREQQLVLAIYSGRIPKPNEEGYWDDDSVRLYLDNWERELSTKRKETIDTIERGSMSFPKHQR